MTDTETTPTTDTETTPTTDTETTPATDVPGADDEQPVAAAPPSAYDAPGEATAATCPDCGRPYPGEELLALHRGLEHEATLTESERETVETAREAEARRLRLFRLKALAVLVVLYFGLLMVYAVFT